MSRRYNGNIKRLKREGTQLWILKIYAFWWKIQQRASGKRERYWSYIVSVFENTPKNLVSQARAQLKHDSLIVKLCVEATCLHFNPDVY